jgi:hypothetical protein
MKEEGLMEWKFWRRKSKGELDGTSRNARTPAESPFAQLAKTYGQRELIALQRVVGNQAVLKLLGVRENRLASDFAPQREEEGFQRSLRKLWKKG